MVVEQTELIAQLRTFLDEINRNVAGFSASDVERLREHVENKLAEVTALPIQVVVAPLPEGVRVVRIGVPGPDDFTWDTELTKFAACETPHLIVEPAPGYEFRYQIMTDSYAIVKK